MTDSNTMQIRLPGGIISAVIDGDLVRARGVPYASAQRFQQPQQLENWDQVLDCTGPAPVCAQQLPNRLGFLTGSLEEGAPQSEQCLHLNVTVPKKAVGDDQVLPVMVFLHGGGYTSGGSDLGCYEPSGLARRGVVAINVSYRLGIFGYLPIPGFAPANLGLFDQIAALKWIQGNIASFGGDPNNVTLFGESAGGDSIFCLMVAQGTSGLFHKAILQSAPLGPRWGDRDPMIRAMSAKAAEWLSQDTQARTTQEMLSLQNDLRGVLGSFSLRSMAFGPALGYKPLPTLAELPRRIDEVAPKIPILIGYNKDDGRPFSLMEQGIRPYLRIPIIGRLVGWIHSWIMTRAIFKRDADALHKQYLRAGGRSILYKFKWAAKKNSLWSAHCLELPFVLGTWESWKTAPMLQGPGSKEAVERLGKEMKDTWVAFARGADQPSRDFVIDDAFTFKGL